MMKEGRQRNVDYTSKPSIKTCRQAPYKLDHFRHLDELMIFAVGRYYCSLIQIITSFCINLEESMEGQKESKDSLWSSNKSPLNTSKAKAMFTFPKQERFPTMHTEGSHQFYEKEPMFDKRSPSFGYGHKVQIGTNNHSPSPDKYSLPSEFAKGPKQGLTMGLSRENCNSISIFNRSNYPGPGQYQLQHQKENIKNVTMSPKLKLPKLWPQTITPGPGAYLIQKIDVNGDCKTTKYDSVSTHKFSKSPERGTKDNKMIGPGAYNTNLSSTGKQVLARNKTQKSFIFPKKERQTFFEDTISPGPGSYQHYSIFGQV